MPGAPAANGENGRGLPMALLRLARPQQWSKNVLVLAAPGAAGVLLEARSIVKTLIAFVCFCLAASGTYCWNDALDVHADRLHPKKQGRPVAAGNVPVATAKQFGSVLLAAAIALSFAATWHLTLVVVGYVLITLAYSTWLKHEPVLDLATVAAGFVLRTVAGGVAVGVPISNWFLIVAASGALFIVTGKRSAEHAELGEDAGLHRRALAQYSAAYLGYVRAMSSTIAILAYCLWAFEVSNRSGNPVWFQLAIIPFVLGVLRYALLLDRGEGGAPEEVLLRDRVLLLIGLAWIVCFSIAVAAN
ncbi:MAG TPA: decaprenyl-phosphate phosphoribosyltransferase [Acidimicrobiia bacterium]